MLFATDSKAQFSHSGCAFEKSESSRLPPNGHYIRERCKGFRHHAGGTRQIRGFLIPEGRNSLKAGKFRAEIVPIKRKIIDPKTENAVEIVVDADDGIRDGVTSESLAKLKTAFTKDGSMHAGMFIFLMAHKPQDRERGGVLQLRVRRPVTRTLSLVVTVLPYAAWMFSCEPFELTCHFYFCLIVISVLFCTYKL